MNKILIVGHPQSGYQEVEGLLNTCGMNSPHPSRREGFLPAEISSTLCKAHWGSSYDGLESGEGIEQIEAGPVWHGMALDLMMGNLDQEFWGWADPQAVFLLNYWRDLDPKITFILLYDKPHSVLFQSDADEAVSLSPEILNQRIRNWCTYNDVLLRFFHRNPQRCLLVNSQQVRHSVRSYLQKMCARIDAPWSEQVEHLLESETGQEHNTDEVISTIGKYGDAHNISLLQTEVIPAGEENALMSYLVDALVQQHPASLQLYEELQSVADLPLEGEAEAGCSPMDAWLGMTAQQLKLREQTQLAASQLKQAEQELQVLKEAQQDSQQEKELLLSQLHQVQVELEKIQTRTVVDTLANSEMVQENELLLNQLHQVQEELERYYLENQRLKKPVYYGAGERIRQQLTYRLGATMIQHSRSLAGWISLPWALVRVARQYRREIPKRKAQKLPPIGSYCDAAVAERYRDHLSYRLGQAFLKNIKTPVGWLRMPWAISREVRKFRQRQEIQRYSISRGA